MVYTLFQPPTDDEKATAISRAYPYEEQDPLRMVRPYIEAHGYPRTVAIGSSHITHWDTYRRMLPRDSEEYKFLRNCTFAGVGGLKLKNAIDWLEGIGLPPPKKHLGNQWLKLKKMHKRPQYVFWAAGSNDCDDIDRFSKHNSRRSLTDLKHKREVLATLADWLTELKEYQTKLI